MPEYSIDQVTFDEAPVSEETVGQGNVYDISQVKFDDGSAPESGGILSPVTDLFKGIYTGITRRIPEQIGQAMQFSNIAPETGKEIADWATEGEDQTQEKGMFRQAGEMMPASSAVPMGLNLVGKAVGAIPHPYAKVAGLGLQGLSYVAAPLLFGLSQAQQTKEGGEKRIKELEDAISKEVSPELKGTLQDELERVKENAKWAPYVTGGIEALGETMGNWALLRLLGPLAKTGAGVVGKTVKESLKPTLGRYAKEVAFKTLPTEILTEMGQNYGEAAVEKGTGIRTGANPWEEAVSAIGPTAIMTLLTGTGGRVLQSHVAGNYVQTVADENRDPADRARVAQSIGQVIRDDYGDPETADIWENYAARKIGAKEPIDPNMVLDKDVMSPSLEKVFDDAMRTSPDIDSAAEKLVNDLANLDPMLALTQGRPPIVQRPSGMSPIPQGASWIREENGQTALPPNGQRALPPGTPFGMPPSPLDQFTQEPEGPQGPGGPAIPTGPSDLTARGPEDIGQTYTAQEQGQPFNIMQMFYNDLEQGAEIPELLLDEYVARGGIIPKNRPELAIRYTKPAAKEVVAPKPKNLLHVITTMGGLSSAKIKKGGYNVKEDFFQHKGLRWIFRKDGRSLDDVASELMSSGQIPPAPEGVNTDDWVYQLLQRASRGEPSTIAEMEYQYNTLVKEQNNDIMELREDLRRDGYNESEIEDVVAAYQRETRTDREPQADTQETTENRDYFVPEVEEPTEETPSGLHPALRPEPIEAVSASPVRPTEGWENEPGAMPGEPILTHANGAIIERTGDDDMVLYEAVDNEGQSLGIFPELDDARRAVEEGTASTPTEGEKRAQTPRGEEAGGELFDTSGMFSLSGDQPHEQKTMKVPEKKGERLLEVEKQDVDQLKDRLSGEKPTVMDEETYLAINAASRQDIGEAALHKNIPEGNTRKKLVKAQAEKDKALVEKREALREEYREKVEKGEIRPPTRFEKLHATANGMEEKDATQAARRVLEKNGIDWTRPLEGQAGNTKKEPWQMTREEHRKAIREKAVRQHGEEWAKKNVDRATASDFSKQIDVKHWGEVEKALSEGKRVPSEVLKDYPDMVERVYIERQLEGKVPAKDLGEAQNVYLTGGPPASGKSTTIEAGIKNKGKYVVVNADDVRRLAGKEQDPDYHEEASRIANVLLNKALDEGYHVIYDSQLTNLGKARKIIEAALKAGGTAQVGLIESSDPAASKTRTVARFLVDKIEGKKTPRYVPDEAIIKGYRYSLPTFKALYEEYKSNPRVGFDLWDNSVNLRDPVHVFEIELGDESLVHDDALFDKFINEEYIYNDDQTKAYKKDPEGSAALNERDSLEWSDSDVQRIASERHGVEAGEREIRSFRDLESAQRSRAAEHQLKESQEQQDTQEKTTPEGETSLKLTTSKDSSSVIETPDRPRHSIDKVEGYLEPLLKKLKNIGKVKVVQSVKEIPGVDAYELSDKDTVYGAYDRTTDTTYIVADSVKDVRNAHAILIHEVIGHRGVEAVLSEDEQYDVMQAAVDAYEGSDLLNKIVKDYELDLGDRVHRYIAGRELIAHMAESGEKPTVMQRIIGIVRDALRRLNFRLKWTDTDIKNLIRKGWEYSEKGGEKTDGDGKGIAFRMASEPSLDDTASVFKTKFNDEARAAMFSIGQKVKSPIWREIFGSPEWINHPVVRKIVDIFTDKRSERYHHYFNDLIDAYNKEEGSVVDELDALRKKDLSLTDIIAGKTSKEYKLLEKAIDNGDIYHITPEKMEEWFKKTNTPEDVVHAWRRLRGSWDNALDLMQRQIRELIADNEGKQGKIPGYESTLDQLKEALAMMDEWRGSYAPRIRPNGNYVLQANRGEGEKKELFRTHGSAREMKALELQMQREGWKTRVDKLSRLPEATYQNIKTVEVANLLENVLKNIKDPTVAAQMNDEIIQMVADTIRARGYRQTMIHRGKQLVTGYITDPMERFMRYTTSLSGGLSKSEIAREAMEEFQKLDPAKEPDYHRQMQSYIRENLRNIEAVDRAFGLAKSIATFKFLGFNLRSLGVNLTAIATTAPPAIHQYAVDGKAGFAKIGQYLSVAGKDYAKFMAGKEGGNDEEQAFLENMRKEGYDDPQYTRDAMAKMQKLHGQLWNKVMGASMYLFGKSEQWNRGTTMLAAFRLARKQGYSVEEATQRAHEASNRAHGVYGKGTLPSWATGDNIGSKIGQAMYTYGKFGHNYVQMLTDLMKTENMAGSGKRNIKAFTWAIMSPVILAGATVFPFRENIMAIFGGMLKALGVSDDPEKWFWDMVREYLGDTAERAGRHGLTGLAGVDISGSLSVGVGIPKSLIELLGPIGGLIDEGIKAGQYVGTGQPGRAAEKLLPTGLANPLRAVREATTGIVSEKGNRVWDEEGRPLTPSAGETAARVVGFRGSRQAVLSERDFESKKLEGRYTDRRNRIYEEFRAYFAEENPSKDWQKKIWAKVHDYNNEVIDKKLRPGVPLITHTSIRNQALKMAKPTKKEMARR
jgi:hypothetical protein